MESNVRIVDHKGLPNNKGRLEMRNSGYFGTVCSKGTGESSMGIICK
jgi:hypothetical protein